jgi:hypothetical protein
VHPASPELNGQPFTHDFINVPPCMVHCFHNDGTEAGVPARPGAGRMCRSRTVALWALVAVLALGGCADAPAQPIETARAAMDRAVALGAEEFAAAGYEQLVRIRAAMEAELDTQAGRLADGAQSVQDLNTQLAELRTDWFPPGELARLRARVAAADTAFAEARMLLPDETWRRETARRSPPMSSTRCRRASPGPGRHGGLTQGTRRILAPTCLRAHLAFVFVFTAPPLPHATSVRSAPLRARHHLLPKWTPATR